MYGEQTLTFDVLKRKSELCSLSQVEGSTYICDIQKFKPTNWRAQEFPLISICQITLKGHRMMGLLQNLSTFSFHFALSLNFVKQFSESGFPRSSEWLTSSQDTLLLLLCFDAVLIQFGAYALCLYALFITPERPLLNS